MSGGGSMIEPYHKMFYFFFFDLACRTAQEDKGYKGFNKITIEILNVHECFAGWFTEKGSR